MRTGATITAGITAALVGLCGITQAQDAPPSPPKVCQLGQVASLDLATGGEGMVFLQGTVEGHSGKFVIDTGGLGLVLGFSTATQLKSGPQRGLTGARMIGGIDLNYGVAARDFSIGTLNFPVAWFLVAPDRAFPSNAIGNIEPRGLWKNYDVEIDFLKSKLNLFLPDQCPGHVVYWTHEPYASVPMTPDFTGHITVQANLDGKIVDALIDTGSQKSFMSLRAASHLLGVDEHTPGMSSLGQIDINGMVQAKRYHYPFKLLTFEGVAIANPDIEIDDTGNDSKQSPLILGIGVLRQLHLFAAYDENKLYLTAAEAH